MTGGSIGKIFHIGKDALMAIAIVGVLLIMIVPMSPFMMDVMLTLSITLALMILMTSMSVMQPLEFSVFPTILLFSTMFRLALNVATTRLILLHGSEGDLAAGKVIRAFGEFVVGGNYVVGFIVFIILIIINFVVITKGAGRISEVAARFTLDAMPGKQLAIDADLNAGIITEAEARQRRSRIESEADFYGAMDGASKFVRGDAVAGLLITIINVLGGFIIGVAQQNMSLTDALKVYTLLTVGDGLVTQIPALIVSTAAGVIVTKVAKEDSLSDSLTHQLLKRWKPLILVACILMLMGFMPGLPSIPFMIMAVIAGTHALRVRKRELQREMQAAENAAPGQAQVEERKEKNEVTLAPIDILRLEVGYDLIQLVDQRVGGTFPSRIIAIRNQFAQEFGVIIPPVHICDNLRLRSGEYRILLKGANVGGGDLLPHHCLAMSPGMTTRKLDGVETHEPAFGLPALWISEEKREEAIVAGYTVVDLGSVMATHLTEIVRRNLHEIFNRQDLVRMIDQFKEQYPKVVSDLIPELLPFGTVLKVLQNLLKEQISVRDLLTIFETLADLAPHTKDIDVLTEQVRVALGRTITQQFMHHDGTIGAICLEKGLEERLVGSIHSQQSGGQMIIEPGTARSIIEGIGQTMEHNAQAMQQPVLLTTQMLRPHLRRLLERFLPNLPVLSHSEVAGNAQVRMLGMIGA